MPRGGRRPGAGRKKGSTNKAKLEREQAMQQAAAIIGEALPDAFAGDAHMLLQAVYKDQSHPVHLRVDAAKAAIKFEKPALAAVADLRPPEVPQPIAPETGEDHLAPLLQHYFGRRPAIAGPTGTYLDVTAPNPAPRDIGQDVREALAKRYKDARGVAGGGALAKQKGKTNGPQ
jgi:hypothetical protein